MKLRAFFCVIMISMMPFLGFCSCKENVEEHPTQQNSVQIKVLNSNNIHDYLSISVTEAETSDGVEKSLSIFPLRAGVFENLTLTFKLTKQSAWTALVDAGGTWTRLGDDGSNLFVTTYYQCTLKIPTNGTLQQRMFKRYKNPLMTHFSDPIFEITEVSGTFIPSH